MVIFYSLILRRVCFLENMLKAIDFPYKILYDEHDWCGHNIWESK